MAAPASGSASRSMIPPQPYLLQMSLKVVLPVMMWTDPQYGQLNTAMALRLRVAADASVHDCVMESAAALETDCRADRFSDCLFGENASLRPDYGCCLAVQRKAECADDYECHDDPLAPR